jgi:HSP20 family molecular chaperone IbpA
MTKKVTKRPDQAPTETTETAETTRNRPLLRPLSDIAETPDGVTLAIEMPGVAADDVDVTLENRVLTIRGRSGAVDPENLQPVHAEYAPGDFERAFTLSEDFDSEKIEAEMKSGVLTLHMPRAEAAQPQKIKVKAS